MQCLVGKPSGKIRLGNRRRIWEDNINMDLQEVGCWVIDWIDLAQDRDRWRTNVKTIINLRGSITCGEFLDQLRTGYLLKKDSMEQASK